MLKNGVFVSGEQRWICHAKSKIRNAGYAGDPVFAAKKRETERDRYHDPDRKQQTLEKLMRKTLAYHSRRLSTLTEEGGSTAKETRTGST